MSARVPVVAPDGTAGTVDAAELDKARMQGFQVETPEAGAKRRAFRQAQQESGLPAFGAGVAESIPFVGGAIEKALSSDPQHLQLLKQAHPFATTLGTGAGILGQTAGIAATGGTEALLEGAGLTGEGTSLLGRAAARGVAGAAEGALYSTGSAVNDAVLQDHPLTAEMLLAHAEGGALTGGLLAGGLSVGSDVLAGGLQKIGNMGRTAALGKIVDQDARALQEAGFGQTAINRAFKEGLVNAGDTAAQVQARVASRLADVQDQIGRIGSKVDASGQTFNLLDLLQKAAKGSTEGETGAAIQKLLKGLTSADEAAPYARLAALRVAAPEVVKDAVDTALIDRAGAVSEELGSQARTLLSDQGDYLQPLQDMADTAVADRYIPSGKSDGLGALLRTGRHFAMWRVLSHMASGHVGAGFLALSAANVLRRIARNPERIAEFYTEALQGVSKAVGASGDALESAVQAGIKGTPHLAGPVAGKLGVLMLPPQATDRDVDQIRDRLVQAQKHLEPNGHPALMAATQRHLQALQAALPPPKANPNLPANLGRPNSGPSSKDRDRYNDTLRAIMNPYGVIADAGRGAAPKAQTDALRAVYPALAFRAGTQMLNVAALAGKPAPISVRRAVETLTGKPIDPALDPGKIARVQAVFHVEPAPGIGGQAPGGRGMKLNQKGMSNLDIAERISFGMEDAGTSARRKR